MNLPEPAHGRWYAPLLAVLDLGRPNDGASALSESTAPELAPADFEETRPIWFVSGIEEDSAVDEGTL
jgi:hypothetical protein